MIGQENEFKSIPNTIGPNQPIKPMWAVVRSERQRKEYARQLDRENLQGWRSSHMKISSRSEIENNYATFVRVDDYAYGVWFQVIGFDIPNDKITIHDHLLECYQTFDYDSEKMTFKGVPI